MTRTTCRATILFGLAMATSGLMLLDPIVILAGTAIYAWGTIAHSLADA